MPTADQKKIANKILTVLDQTASQLEGLSKTGSLDPKLASALIKDIDTFSDKFEATFYGNDSLVRRQAKVLKQDPDEGYMKTYENPVKPIKTDADEEYMHKLGPSFNSKAIGTYDVDRSSTVSERDEYAVRDLSEWSDATQKQPSWAKGSAGKSTKTGATAPEAPKGPKTWAP